MNFDFHLQHFSSLFDWMRSGWQRVDLPHRSSYRSLTQERGQHREAFSANKATRLLLLWRFQVLQRNLRGIAHGKLHGNLRLQMWLNVKADCQLLLHFFFLAIHQRVELHESRTAWSFLAGLCLDTWLCSPSQFAIQNSTFSIQNFSLNSQPERILLMILEPDSMRRSLRADG